MYLAATCLLLGLVISAFGQDDQVTITRSVTIVTEPNAVIWINDLRYGKTDEKGRFTIDPIAPGSHKIRVRADGFKELVKPITAAQEGEISIALTKTTDPAELAFQEAERLAVLDREKAIAAYRKAIKLRPGYPQPYIALIRTLSDAGDRPAALQAIRELRRTSPRNAEASAIEGRLHKENDEEAKAIASFKRAITEGRGVQPEAYTGLGMLYKERAEGLSSDGDAENVAANYAEAAKHLKTALKQLGTAPDALVIYQLLGLIYERQKMYTEAIALYRDALRTFPNSNEATAFRSFIVQLQKQMGAQE